MDKKFQLRPSSTKAQELAKPNGDYPSKKVGIPFTKKRDVDKYDFGKKNQYHHSGRGNTQRYSRSKEKFDGKDSEIGSIQRSGGKKQNITHLLNWWDSGSEHHRGTSFGDRHGARSKKVNHVKYNKEHFLLANCQFVVNQSCKVAAYEKNPDSFVDWDLVEEVWLRASEYPACPICLHPPVAAKITKCGHIFCFACVLHYLALTDKKWQKCPICYDAIMQDDLKSVVTHVRPAIRSGEEVELELMRRARDSFIPVPVADYPSSIETKTLTLSDARNQTVFNKFITASPNEVCLHILGREEAELNCQMAVEGDQPEACFISGALDILNTRKKKMISKLDNADDGQALTEQFLPVGMDNHAEEIGVDVLHSLKHDVIHEAGAGGKENAEFDLFAGLVDRNASANASRDTSKAIFYFFQEKGGNHVYLHPLNIHMLTTEYGSLECCPLTIKGKVLEKESGIVTESVRNRFRYLRHLPIACPYEFVELLIEPPLISSETIAEYQDQLTRRAKKRRKRVKQEFSIAHRVRIEEDRIMGRSRGADINTTSFEHFPTFNEDFNALNLSADEESLPSSVSSITIDCNDNSPSFAQMIRCGQKKPDANPWGGARTKVADPKISRQDDDEDKCEDWERVPDFGATFSDAFAKALDLAAKNASESPRNSESSNKRGKKGKKKNKGIVLLSSGGR